MNEEEKAKREVEKKACYEKNKAFLNAQMYDKLKECAQKTTFGNDYEFDDIFHTSVIKFLESYKAEQNGWKTFFTMIFVNTAKDMERKRKRMLYKAQVADDNADENAAAFEGEPDKNIEAVRDLIETYSLLRDCVLTRIKDGRKKKETGYFTCFFTEDMTNGILHSTYLLAHVSGEEKKYNSAVNMGFANHYSADKCDNITETVKAGLKPISEFRTDCNSNEACGYPLQNAVYTSYFDVSDASISSNRTKYREWISLIG